MPSNGQETPPPGAAPLALLLIGVGTNLREQLNERLSVHGMTMRHFGALAHLSNAPELSTSELARRARVTPQSMRATIEHLEEIGAIEHHRHGRGRASELLVTDHGRHLLDTAQAIVADLDTEFLDHLSDQDALRAELTATVLQLISRKQPDNLV